MISMKSVTATAVFAALATATAAGSARADDAVQLSVKPLKVINLDVGSKRAIGYYLADGGQCSLTVLLTDFSFEGEQVPTASRVSVDVAAGTTAKVDTIDGTTLAFSCAAGASEMGVRRFMRYAQSPVLRK